MDNTAHFKVDTRLTRVLGETYRSSESALKELVDNAWDADAKNVWITLPDPLTTNDIVVKDDGSGMTSRELRTEYLNIASDKRTRTGERTRTLNRPIKGRKGIGKFAGLTMANIMEVTAVARGKRCRLLIDKTFLMENASDLEAVPLPFTEEEAGQLEVGTTVRLSSLDSRLNFPTPDRLREVLIYEYGREDTFKVFVNDSPLSVDDVPGVTAQAITALPIAGDIKLTFTVAEGKRPPRSPGVILKVDGKAVGRPLLFGLDEDEEIPEKLARRVYGEVELTGIDDFVTADWGGVLENSKAFQEIAEFIKSEVKQGLKESHARDLNLQKARLRRQVDQRLQQLPEYRRHYAEIALNRILRRFYGETEERIAVIADVALDAMEHDAYWAVFNHISESSHGDVSSFAESLDAFGMLELATIGTQADRRRRFLDYLDSLVQNPETQEKDIHKALEANLWVFGRRHSMMASNITLKNIVKNYCDQKFTGARGAKRPDLLLSQDYHDTYLLIEFKRPKHDITRDDIAQAEKYRDDLGSRLSSTKAMGIMMIGGGRTPNLDTKLMLPSISIHSYGSIISTARSELDWLIASLNNAIPGG